MTEFSKLGLSPATLEAVAATGYTEATPIQDQAIPVALAGRDVLGIAQTGTGKTAAFTLPMIDRLVAGRSKARMPRSLVISPTRELADQVAASFERYSKGQKLSWALLIGGVSFGDQEAKLDRGVDVLIATPRPPARPLRARQAAAHRRADHGGRRGRPHARHGLHPGHRAHLQADAAEQADPVLLGHHAAGDHPAHQAVPARTRSGSRRRGRRPRPRTSPSTSFACPTRDPAAKRLALRALIAETNVRNGIVFCNRKSEVDIVAKSLKKHGFDASPIHGDLDQSQRTKTLEAFRKGELKLLVASDVAARGLDIPDVSHVFNYDVPHHADDYVHRIGRTGRAGAQRRLDHAGDARRRPQPRQGDPADRQDAGGDQARRRLERGEVGRPRRETPPPARAPRAQLRPPGSARPRSPRWSRPSCSRARNAPSRPSRRRRSQQLRPPHRRTNRAASSGPRAASIAKAASVRARKPGQNLAANSAKAPSARVRKPGQSRVANLAKAPSARVRKPGPSHDANLARAVSVPARRRGPSHGASLATKTVDPPLKVAAMTTAAWSASAPTCPLSWRASSRLHGPRAALAAAPRPASRLTGCLALAA